MRLIIITLVSLFFCTVTFSAEPGLTDKEAKAFIETLFNRIGYGIHLGSMTVVATRNGEPDIYEDKISEKMYKAYQILEKLGIIKISVTKVYDPRAQGWDDWNAYSWGMRKKSL